MTTDQPGLLLPPLLEGHLEPIHLVTHVIADLDTALARAVLRRKEIILAHFRFLFFTFVAVYGAFVDECARTDLELLA